MISHPLNPLKEVLLSLSRNSPWSLISDLSLRFPTFHPQGLAVDEAHYYLSTVEILSPTQKLSRTDDQPYDRTPGWGIGHLLIISRATGQLEHDILLNHDAKGAPSNENVPHTNDDVGSDRSLCYHPGGIHLSSATSQLYIPIAQYRPHSYSLVLVLDTQTLTVRELLSCREHIGGIAVDEQLDRVWGITWGSRHFVEWNLSTRQELHRWPNPSETWDLQDLCYLGAGWCLGGGIAELIVPTDGPVSGAAAHRKIEFGGLSLMHLTQRKLVKDVPVQSWTEVGHVMTRNPIAMELVAERTESGNGDLVSRVRIWLAPDDEEDVGGTRIYEWFVDVKLQS